jgi:hypothetical protein
MVRISAINDSHIKDKTSVSQQVSDAYYSGECGECSSLASSVPPDH